MNWNECEHEWEDYDNLENVIEVRCIKCGCPGEKYENEDEVYWPTT